MIDHTHDPAARSWIDSANGHLDFPIQNLPLGVFAPDGEEPRAGIAIGNEILDLRALSIARLLPAPIAAALRKPDLRDFLALGTAARRTLRHRVFELLAHDSTTRALLEGMAHPAARCAMALPARPGGFTDFYAGIHHATNVGKLLRPDNPLMPNYKFVPIGYHGRTSSVRVSGTDVRRPSGQTKSPDAVEPVFGPTQRLDYELEIGFWIGEASTPDMPVSIDHAEAHLAGVTLLNDWSARDVQAWEYQPLGPFLAKNFATTVSPWLVTWEALAPFRIACAARSAGDPSPLPHLDAEEDQRRGALSIELSVAIRSAMMRKRRTPALVIGETSAQHLYWTPAQLVAHHTSNGCGLESADLLGSGTISSPNPEGWGSLMEVTRGGTSPLKLPDGTERRFLEDGDQVIMTGRCTRDGYVTIGFGECVGTIQSALAQGAPHG